LSAKDRKRIAELAAINELYLAFKENGRKLPTYLNYGVFNRQEIDQAYALAEALLDELPKLMPYCRPGGEDERTLKLSGDLTQRFINGVNAMRQLPKQAPKHRQALLDLWNRAGEGFEEIRKCVEVWGITPEDWGLIPLKDNQAPF